MATDTDTLENPSAKTQMLATTALTTMTAEEIEAAASQIVDGIYFALDDRIYHTVARLSCSGIQKLLVSPATFWRGSWLDPDRPELDEEATKAQTLGKAYHCARLEPDQFEQRYVRELAKNEFPAGTLFTGTDMGKALEERGLKKTGTVLEQARRLSEEGGFAETHLWHIALDQWEKQRAGRIPIGASYFDDLVRDQQRLLASKEIAPLFEGGESEVSIFWTDEYGIQMKARLDRLTADRILDLKTYDNSRGKQVDKAINDAIQYNRYYVQPPIYMDAVEAVRDGKAAIQGDATEAQHRLVAEIRLRPAPHFWFIFQEKGGVPNLFARRFKFYELDAWRQSEVDALVEEGRKAEVEQALGRKTMIYQRALADIYQAKQTFMAYSQIYDPGRPWAPVHAIGTVDDADFSEWWLEGRTR